MIIRKHYKVSKFRHLMVRDSKKGKLAALKEFKAEYGVGSSEAWNYMNARKDFEQIRDQVASNLKAAGVSHKPTVSEISSLCQVIEGGVYRTLNDYADLLIEKQGLDHSMNYKEHIVRSASNTIGKTLDSNIDPQTNRLWDFDYANFITQMYKWDFTGHQFEGRTLEEEEMPTRLGLTHTLLFASSDRYLKDEKGRELSFSDFSKNPQLLLELSGELFSQREIEEITEMSPANNTSQDAEEEFRQKFDHNLQSLTEFLGQPIKMTPEESTFLRNWGTMYQRAKREGVQNRLEVERRLALGAILRHGGRNFEESYHTELASAQRSLKRRREIEKIKKMLIEDPAKHTDETTEPTYRIGILKRHKSWLEKMLTN